jgi:selenocysteine lyase/cysteine desulfurase
MSEPVCNWDPLAIRRQIVGVDEQTPLLDGQSRTYICLDNAASTPTLRPVLDKVNEFLTWYSSVHRGTGFKSQLATWAYGEAREIVLRFVGADPRTHTVIFGKNTTEALNKLAHRYRARGQRVLTTVMEHHSNLLPWRVEGGLVDYVRITADGRLDEADLAQKLEQYGKAVGLVAVTGASNVTGYVNPIHRLAEIAHRFGARILVDAAQLAPHRQIRMGDPGDPTAIDFLSLSAHKMYAPFGAGALIGPRDFFADGEPDMVGGGVIDIVTLERTVWAAPPERDEAGSPNVVGAVALAAAAQMLEGFGWPLVEGHEVSLTSYLLDRLRQVPGLHVLGSGDPEDVDERLGVVSFVLDGVPHALAAAILGDEYGIGVRHGCFCAHPYLLELLRVSPSEAARYQAAIERGDRSDIPGAVRASLGIYNTPQEVDALVDALKDIVQGRYTGVYELDACTGDYHPQGYTVSFEKYFSFVR